MVAKRVLVLLSTYNGEKYIGEQIDSIIVQENVDVSILIRDDGSNDNTVQLLANYESNKIRLIKGENVGATQSFIKLIEECEGCEYYAFADQDDVWDSDKLFVAIQELEKHRDIPALYSSNTRLVDFKLNVISKENKNPKIDLGSALVKNYVTGCTTVFNDLLMKQLKKYSPSNVAYHDWWANLITLSVGGISIYDDTPHISYRQHEHNVVGAPNGALARWKTRFKKYKSNCYYRNQMADQILKYYSNDLTNESREILDVMASYRSKKVKIILDARFKTRKILDNILFAICVITDKI